MFVYFPLLDTGARGATRKTSNAQRHSDFSQARTLWRSRLRRRLRWRVCRFLRLGIALRLCVATVPTVASVRCDCATVRIPSVDSRTSDVRCVLSTDYVGTGGTWDVEVPFVSRNNTIQKSVLFEAWLRLTRCFCSACLCACGSVWLCKPCACIRTVALK